MKEAKTVQKIKKVNKKIVTKAKHAEEIAKETAEKAREKAKESTEKGEVGGFFAFLKAQNVAGLAIGLAVGTAATDTVRKFVQGFVDPIVQLLIGSQESLQRAVWHVKILGRSADIEWGAFLSSLITLFTTAIVIYAALRMSGLYKAPVDEESKTTDKKKEDKK